ncbi:MAG: aminotransferase DegT [Acidobacteria bacterium]|nr:MAG: aminotransferase DegT [Acidobacteriota bacterium]
MRYCGATPVFVDVEEDTGNMNPDEIPRKTTSRTKGIVPVHLYGHPANMGAIQELANEFKLWILEDAAEAHGALYKNQKVGSFGQAATYSFYGNKIITTGEGGMITTNDDKLASQMRLFKGQGQDPNRRYWFPVIGYNYRMTNVEAAIGLAQLERIEYLIRRKLEIAASYGTRLQNLKGIVLPVEKDYAKSVFWLYNIRIKSAEQNPGIRESFMGFLKDQGIETRPFFHPIHLLPPYQAMQQKLSLPVSEQLGASGVSLPSSPSLTEDDISYICDMVTRWLS